MNAASSPVRYQRRAVSAALGTDQTHVLLAEIMPGGVPWFCEQHCTECCGYEWTWDAEVKTIEGIQGGLFA